MSDFRAGFARVNITPAMGIPVAGYYQVRLADTVLDELECNVLAASAGGETVLLISCDIIGMKRRYHDPICAYVSQRTGVPEDHILITCTHTHTGPKLDEEIVPDMQADYFHFLKLRLADAAAFAIADLKPAKLAVAEGQSPGIAFVRRYRMKDGSIRTNPGVDNPDVVAPVGLTDERVGVMRIDREGGPSIVIANFGCHPDTIGGCNISADWPGFARRTVEKALDNVRCIVLNGAQGDINHVNVKPAPGQNNDLVMDFDDVMRGYGHARHMGRVVAGAALQVYDKAAYIDVESVTGMTTVIDQPSNMPSPEELPEAHRINDLHQAGRDAELPYVGMMLTTIVAEAERMLQLEHGPASFRLCMGALKIGPVGVVGIPGEPFNAVGTALKTAKDYALVMPCCCSYGYEGYFPNLEAYQEGGYESRSSIFKAGVAETLAETGLRILTDLK